MTFWSRDIGAFTKAESFQLYMEGLRNLQLYEDEASKEGFPSEGVLSNTLSASARLLVHCVAAYPHDLLPRYYLGLVLTLQAQATQARQLRTDLDHLRSAAPSGVSSAAGAVPAAVLSIGRSDDAEGLYEKAATEFAETAARARRDLEIYAQYNCAQALAKQVQALGLRPQPDLDRIRRVSERARSILHSLTPLSERVRSRVGSSRLGRGYTSLIRRFGFEPRPESHVGPTVSAVNAENIAFKYQVDLLTEFVERWLAAIEGKLRLTDFPDSTESSPAAKASLDRLESELRKDIPPQARQDIQADYWSKWAYLARTWVQSGAPESIQAELLDRAHRYYLQLFKFGSYQWPPAKLNEAFVAALSGDYDRAAGFLAFILGQTPPAVVIQAAPASPDVEQIKTYILAMPLGTPAATVASLVTSAFGPLEAPTLQTLTRALDHARLKMEFIDEIVGALRRSMSPEATHQPRASEGA